MSRMSILLILGALAAGVAAGAEEPPQPTTAEGTIGPLARNKAKSDEFFAKLDVEEGVQKTPSGLRIRIERAGDGSSPASTDSVRVNYRGTQLDGTEFDSSYKRGQSATFPLNGVIACWTEGLQLLKTGGKATLYCPSDIAYGDRGRPPVIPAGATLVFDVELIEIMAR
jgi:FKBP-type peptidyl-prolyl cis-trans isomerase FkpA